MYVSLLVACACACLSFLSFLYNVLHLLTRKPVGLSPEEMERVNRAWLEDCCVRMLCVFALDRFADFVGDKVVTPVRETCAQALGTVMMHVPESTALRVFEILCELVRQSSWEVCERSTRHCIPHILLAARRFE